MRVLSVFILLISTNTYTKTLKISSKERNNFLKNIVLTYPLQNHPLHKARDFYAPTISEIQKGPQINILATQNKIIYCRYNQRDNNGSNPKFRCWLTNVRGQFIDKNNYIIDEKSKDKIELKIKYRKQHKPNIKTEKDMYTEVFATHLLWSLGFYSDIVFPTQKVVCFDCPKNPFRNKKPHLGNREEFDHASFELRFPEKSLSYKGHKGWTFMEINKLKKDHRLSPQTHIHFDALAALMGILVHSSNSRHQQRMSCSLHNIDEKNFCTLANGFVQDLGSILGSQHPLLGFSKTKATLEKWKQSPLWRDRSRCKLNLLFKGKFLSYTRITISEEGKQFLLHRLNQITADPIWHDERLKTLFTKAKFHLVDHDLIQNNPKLGSNELTMLWVNAFKDKVNDLENSSCRSISNL